MARLYQLPSTPQTGVRLPRIAKPLAHPVGRLGGGLQPSMRAATPSLAQQYGNTPTANMAALTAYARMTPSATHATPHPITNPGTTAPRIGSIATPITQPGTTAPWQPGNVAHPIPQPGPEQGWHSNLPPLPGMAGAPAATAPTYDSIKGQIESDPRWLLQHPGYVADQNRDNAYYGWHMNPDGSVAFASKAEDPYSVYNTLRHQTDQGVANTQNAGNASGTLFSGATAAGINRAQDAFNRNLYDAMNTYQGKMSDRTAAENGLRSTIGNDLYTSAKDLATRQNPIDAQHHASAAGLYKQYSTASTPKDARAGLAAIYKIDMSKMPAADREMLQGLARRLRAIIQGQPGTNVAHPIPGEGPGRVPHGGGKPPKRDPLAPPSRPWWEVTPPSSGPIGRRP